VTVLQIVSGTDQKKHAVLPTEPIQNACERAYRSIEWTKWISNRKIDDADTWRDGPVTPLLAQRVGERLGELGRERKHRAVCVRGERKSHRSGRM